MKNALNKLCIYVHTICCLPFLFLKESFIMEVIAFFRELFSSAAIELEWNVVGGWCGMGIAMRWVIISCNFVFFNFFHSFHEHSHEES